MVKITSDTESISEKSEDYYNKFTIVVATGLNTKQLLTIDSTCRSLKVQFICGDVFGMFGYSLSDFQEHDYYMYVYSSLSKFKYIIFMRLKDNSMYGRNF